VPGWNSQLTIEEKEGETMQEITTVVLDLAKNVFHLIGCNEHGKQEHARSGHVVDLLGDEGLCDRGAIFRRMSGITNPWDKSSSTRTSSRIEISCCCFSVSSPSSSFSQGNREPCIFN
jgi:hypothetical protein